MPRRIFPFVLALSALAFTACGDDDSGVSSIEVSVADAPPVELTAGAATETHAAENRAAQLTIFKANIARNSETPYSAELVRTIDAEIYRDVDPGIGPEFWILRAHVEDADGNILWEDRENSPFQLIELLEVILEQQSIPLGAPQIYAFISQQYPQLIEFAVRVPTGIEGGTEYVLSIPDTDGQYYEVARHTIADLQADAAPPQTTGEVTTIFENAPAKDALDIVILGDGYREADQEKFVLDAQAVAEELIEAEPFASYEREINVHRIWTPSNDIGAGYDCTGDPLRDGGCADALKDTVFGTVFVITALADIYNLGLNGASDRVAMPIEVARMYDVASLANYDEIILVSNTRRRSGFAGLYVSVVTTFDRDRVVFPHVAVHELGHSFGVLGDEYMVDGDPCLFNEPRVPLPANVSTYDGDEIKWSRWIVDGTPIPTTASDRALYPVGGFEGAYNCDYLYRASHDCKMNTSEEIDFCPVCTEQLTRRIHAALDPVRAEPATVEPLGDGRFEFAVPAYEDGPWTVTWTLDDEPIGEGPALELRGSDVKAGGETSRLRAEVRDATGFARIDDPTLAHVYEWKVRGIE